MTGITKDELIARRDALLRALPTLQVRVKEAEALLQRQQAAIEEAGYWIELLETREQEPTGSVG